MRMAHPRAPDIDRKIKRKHPKKESRNFQPQNSSDSSKRPKKSAHASSRSARKSAGLSRHFRHAGNATRRRDVFRLPLLILNRSLRMFLRPLLSDPPRNANTNADFLAQLICIHPERLLPCSV
jgi:hypothetical protein